MTTYSNVQLSNTFNEFRQAHNDVANTLTDITGASGTIQSDVDLYVDVVEANTINSSTVNSSNVISSSLTSGRVALVGTSGLLQDDAGLTYNTSTNVLTADGAVVSANLYSTDSLEVEGDVTFGTGSNTAVFFAANGGFQVYGDDTDASGRIDAWHVHALKHVAGGSGNVETWAAGKGQDTETHHVAGIGDQDAAVDMVVVNESNGANAYAEFIAINDAGDIENGWVSLGINSSNYAEGAYDVTKADDGYILYQAPANTVASGDLVIGTGSNGTANRIIFSANGFDDPANNTQLVITPGQNIHVEIDTESSNTITGALTVNGGIGLVGNLNVGGNVSITGTITLGGGGNTVSTDSLAVDSPILYLGANNAADVLDLGIVGYYNDGTEKYTGIVRDANDNGIVKFFSNTAILPTTTVDFSDTNLIYVPIKVGALEANNTTASSSTSTGALIVKGGAGIAEDVYAGGDIYDSKGNVREVPINATSSGTYTLVSGDSGKTVTVDGNTTVPPSVFTAGQAITIFNNSGSSISILQGSGVTLRQAGTSSTGTRTLAQYGICTVLCVASNTFVVNGGGLT